MPWIVRLAILAQNDVVYICVYVFGVDERTVNVENASSDGREIGHLHHPYNNNNNNNNMNCSFY